MHSQSESHHIEASKNTNLEARNKHCSGAHKIENKNDAAKYYRSYCEDFEKAGCRFYDLETLAQNIKLGDHTNMDERPVDRLERQTRSSLPDKSQNKRCSGAHKVVNKTDVVAYFTQSCKEFEEAGFSFSKIECHALAIGQDIEHVNGSSKASFGQPQEKGQDLVRNKHFSGLTESKTKRLLQLITTQCLKASNTKPMAFVR
jgi:hypothetical protein